MLLNSILIIFFFTFIHECSYEQSKMLLEELEELENNFFFFYFSHTNRKFLFNDI